MPVDENQKGKENDDPAELRPIEGQTRAITREAPSGQNKTTQRFGSIPSLQPKVSNICIIYISERMLHTTTVG
jgi:hypothetical protein